MKEDRFKEIYNHAAVQFVGLTMDAFDQDYFPTKDEWEEKVVVKMDAPEVGYVLVDIAQGTLTTEDGEEKIREAIMKMI